MNFTELQELLRVELRRRIERGSLSVTLLAKKSGLGQGHVSNFLKGRSIRDDSKNKILHALALTVERLLPPSTEMIRRNKLLDSRTITVRMVPLVSHHAAIFDEFPEVEGNQQPLPFQASMLAGFSFPSKIRRSTRRFVGIRLDERDVRGMEPVLTPGAVLLLDRHYKSFKQYPATTPDTPLAKAVSQSQESEEKANLRKMNLYAVRSGQRILIRYAEYHESCLILRPYEPTEAVEVRPVKSLVEATDLLVGRVAMILAEVPGIAGN